MDKRVTAIALLAVVSLVLGFTLNPWTDENDAVTVADAESLQELMTTIEKEIQSDSGNKYKQITLINDIELSQPLILDLGKEKTDGKSYSIQFSLGQGFSYNTLRFVGDFEGPAIQIINNGPDNIDVVLKSGSIIDDRESEEQLTTIEISNNGSGSTSVSFKNDASVNMAGNPGQGSSVISLSGVASMDYEGTIEASDENAVGIELDGSSVDVSNKDALISTCSNAIISVGTSESTIKITSGTVRSSENSAIKIGSNTDVTVVSGLIVGNETAFELTDGNDIEIKMENGGGVYSSDISQYLPEGYELAEINGRWFASPTTNDPGMSLVEGDTKVSFGNLNDIADAIKSSDVDLHVVLEKDLSEELTLYSTVNLTLDLYGKNITVSDSDAIRIEGPGIKTITDSVGGSTVTGTDSAILNLGNLTIEGGTFKGGDYAVHQSINSSGTLTIKNGTFGAEKALSVEKGTAVIENGTFTGTVAGVECYSLGGYSPSITINGGTISAPTGATALGNGSGTATLILNGGTIIGTTNMGIGGNAGNDNTVIEINGGTVECKGTENCAAIYHPQKGTLSISGGEIIGKTGISFCGSGSISISGGTITGTGADEIDGHESGPISDGSALSVVSRGTGYQSEGEKISVSITGGSLVSENANGISEYTYSYANGSPITGDGSGVESVVSSFVVSDGTVTGAEGKKAVKGETTNSYSVTGGTFLSGSSPDESVEEYTAPGYEIDDAGDIIVDADEAYFRVGDEYFMDLQSAIDAAENGDTITMLSDVTISETIDIPAGKSIVLDMDGHAITPDAGFTGRMLVNDGTLTITGDGIIDASAKNEKLNGPIDNHGTLTIESGTFIGNLESNSALIWNRAGGNATFNGGEYYGSGTAIATESGSNTTINGGTYTSPWYPAFENRGEALITGGEFTNPSCSSCDSKHWGYTIRNGKDSDTAHLVIDPEDDGDVIVTGTQGGVTTVGGTMEIYGGTFRTVDCDEGHGAAFYALYVAGEFDDTVATIYDGIFTSFNRSAVFVGNSNDGGNQEAATVVIRGGSYSVSNDDSVDLVTVDAETHSMPQISISGGDFDRAIPQDYLEEGFVLAEDDGKYGVGQGRTVSFDVNVDGYEAEVTSADGTIAYEPEADGTYLLSDGAYEATFTAEGYETIVVGFEVSGADRTIQIGMPLSGIVITEDDQTVDCEVDGGVVTIPSDGEHKDVTLNLWYGETTVTVSGDVTGDVTISYDPFDGTDGSDLAFELGISGMSVTGMSVTVTIPVAVEPGYHIDEDSVSAYSIVDGAITTETAYASGDAIVIETDHNTPFYVSYDLEADLPPFIPFPPEQGGDPVEVYPSGDSGSSDGGDDTLKVVACAAAVVIAAILVIVLASTYRRNR